MARRWLAAAASVMLAAPVKLFATDLDGTLVGPAGRIHPRDVEAIGLARERGVIVTIATGRLTTGTHALARELRIDAPFVCADGGVTACGVTQRLLDRRPIRTTTVEPLLADFAEHGLASFLFTHDTIHSCERGRPHHAYVSGWSPRILTHDDVLASDAWRAEADAAVMLVGIGGDKAVEHVERRARSAREPLDAITFGVRNGPERVVRIVAGGVSKGAALAAVARQLGVEQKDVAVAGDWYNDASMFAWAGRSWAMPHAPADVKALATHVIEPEAAREGAIAHALERWLDGG